MTGITYNDAHDIVARRSPKEVQDGSLKITGDQPTKLLKLDTTQTEQVFGIQFKSYEEQVVSVLERYVELGKKAKEELPGVA